ncbi:MAG: DUF2752 domain-containing protein [Planctomycetota bacterium]
MDLGLALLAGGMLAAAAWLSPAGDTVFLVDGRTAPTLCWVREVSGVDCPFCGMTRSFVAFMHGDVAASFGWHPAGPLLLSGAALLLVCAAAMKARRRRPLWGRRGFVAALTAIAWVCLLAGLARNL